MRPAAPRASELGDVSVDVNEPSSLPRSVFQKGQVGLRDACLNSGESSGKEKYGTETRMMYRITYAIQPYGPLCPKIGYL